jgi:hypothetical protein
MSRQVFISHSCNEDPAELGVGDPRRARLERARSVREAIVEKLGGPFEVWLDRSRLRAGDPWRLEIYQALYRCSAGVILLDEDAFASPWVRQEATILNFRRRLNPGFVLIPVLLDGGSTGRFDEGDWRPLALRDWMAMKTSPDAVADEVAGRLADAAQLSEDPDLEQWVSLLAGMLRRTAMEHPERLTASCQRLGIATPGDWAADNASAIAPFARALLTQPPPTVAAVANQHLKATVPNQERRQEVSRLLVPIWVDLTAAAGVAFALRQPAAERRVLLNTDSQDVAAEYVDRAVYCAEGTVQIRSKDVFGEDLEQLFDDLEQLVIDNCPPIWGDPSRKGFEEWLATYPYRRPVLFLRALLPLEKLKVLLDRLAHRFPGLTLFVLDPAAEGGAADIATIGVTFLDPPLDPAAKGRADQYRGELQMFVGGDQRA